jgi:hypothetical protein
MRLVHGRPAYHARKPYLCRWCGNYIEKGEEYRWMGDDWRGPHRLHVRICSTNDGIGRGPSQATA